MRMCLSILFIWLLSAGAMAQGDTISNDAAGESCIAEARRILASLGVTIDRQILIKVRPRDEVQVHHNMSSRNIEVVAFYQPFDPETIWVVAGYPRTVAISEITHELAHAWQSTNCPLQDRTITEGFATWCGLKALVAQGDMEHARMLLGITAPDYAEGLRLFLSIEKKEGIKGVVEYAKTAVKPPQQ